MRKINPARETGPTKGHAIHAAILTRKTNPTHQWRCLLASVVSDTAGRLWEGKNVFVIDGMIGQQSRQLNSQRPQLPTRTRSVQNPEGEAVDTRVCVSSNELFGRWCCREEV
jgi:hypothetical protein